MKSPTLKDEEGALPPSDLVVEIANTVIVAKPAALPRMLPVPGSEMTVLVFHSQ
jgi:hypothetical protein